MVSRSGGVPFALIFQPYLRIITIGIWKWHTLYFPWIELQILAPIPIGFAVFLVHLATIPITGTGINPARSLGAAIIYNRGNAWDDMVSENNAL